IMHNKFVVLLDMADRAHPQPVAVWTGSTNWTDGAIYGQLNVGHAIFDSQIASKYEQYYRLLRRDASASDMKAALKTLSPVPGLPAAAKLAHGITPIFSPQSSLSMIDLYADIAHQAKVLMVSAPFLLHEKIRAVFDEENPGALRYLMADK